MTNLQNKIMSWTLLTFIIITFIGMVMMACNIYLDKKHKKDEVFMNKCTEYTNVENCKELMRL